MTLTVLSVAFPFAPVGPDAVGGAEQILSSLDHALVQAGHRSIVVACEGSSTAGALIAVPKTVGPITEAARRRAQACHRAAIESALRRWPVDLVHMHGLDFSDYLPAPGVPVLATLHLPPEWYPPTAFAPGRPNTFVHCVSAAQRARCPPGARPAAGHPERRADRRAGRAACQAEVRARARPDLPGEGFPPRAGCREARRSGPVARRAVFPYGAHQTYFRREIVTASRPTSAGSSGRSGLPASGACSARRAACWSRAWHTRPARWSRWRRSPAARPWSRSRPAPCPRSSSTAGPGSSSGTSARWPMPSMPHPASMPPTAAQPRGALLARAA